MGEALIAMLIAVNIVIIALLLGLFSVLFFWFTDLGGKRARRLVAARPGVKKKPGIKAVGKSRPSRLGSVDSTKPRSEAFDQKQPT